MRIVVSRRARVVTLRSWRVWIQSAAQSFKRISPRRGSSHVPLASSFSTCAFRRSALSGATERLALQPP